MTDINWKEYFSNKVERYKGSSGSSDYFDEKSFCIQRDNTLKWLGKLEGKTILDAGCGVGAFSEPLVKDNEVYGADFVEKALEYASKRGLKTVCGDITNLPFESNKFDVVICIGVLQLVKDYRKLLDELNRVTKPGGTLVIETLNRNSIQRKLYLMINRAKTFDAMYDIRELKDVFEAMGFEDIEFMNMYHPFNYAGFTRKTGMLSRGLSTSFAIKAVKG